MMVHEMLPFLQNDGHINGTFSIDKICYAMPDLFGIATVSSRHCDVDLRWRFYEWVGDGRMRGLDLLSRMIMGIIVLHCA